MMATDRSFPKIQNFLLLLLGNTLLFFMAIVLVVTSFKQKVYLLIHPPPKNPPSWRFRIRNAPWWLVFKKRRKCRIFHNQHRNPPLPWMFKFLVVLCLNIHLRKGDDKCIELMQQGPNWIMCVVPLDFKFASSHCDGKDRCRLPDQMYICHKVGIDTATEGTPTL